MQLTWLPAPATPADLSMRTRCKSSQFLIPIQTIGRSNRPGKGSLTVRRVGSSLFGSGAEAFGQLLVQIEQFPEGHVLSCRRCDVAALCCEEERIDADAFVDGQP